MLEHYFTKPTRLRQLRRGPFGPHIDALAGELRHAGYTATTAPHLLTCVAKFSSFAQASGVLEASQIDEVLVRRFLDDLAVEGEFKVASSAMRHMLDHLRRTGAIARSESVHPDDPLAALLERYDVHLRDVQGLQPSTREGNVRTARRLLDWHRGRSGDKAIGRLSRADVLAFVTGLLERRHSAAWRGHVLSETRVFLRFLGGTGMVAVGLEKAVPRAAARHRLSSLPRHLPWEQVRALIESVDATHPAGMRDKAVLLVLATLGLRNAEVRRLELADIAWRVGEIRLRRTKTGKERVLPMTQELGVALADYVLHGRPAIDVPQVFLRVKAPVGPFTASAAVAAIVKLHLHRAGIPAPGYGAHLLRHSLATRMVNAGVPIKSIADVLGHASINTTAIYAKVDTTRLATAALPFPAGGEA